MAASNLYAIVFLVLFAVGGNFADDTSKAEIKEGCETKNCVSEHIEKPTNSKTYRAPSATQPIVGVFVTRDAVENDIWGKGVLKGLKLAKKNCYDSAVAFKSVISGTTEAPLTIDLVFGSMAKEICSYGYTVKVCFKETT